MFGPLHWGHWKNNLEKKNIPECQFNVKLYVSEKIYKRGVIQKCCTFKFFVMKENTASKFNLMP